jgi:FkbM family methyltransferase
MGRVAEPGAMFVDVGANLGMFALVARSYGFETIVVEPEPKHAGYLMRNPEVFKTVIPVALSDQPGALPLYYEKGNSGSMSLFATDAYRKGGEVPVTTFSELARLGKLGPPENIRLVKVDVEGFEAQMVRGMQDVLRTGIRPHLWCELRGDRSGRNGGSFRSVREILGEFGYRMKRLRKGQELSTSDQDLSKLGVFDALFVSDGR